MRDQLKTIISMERNIFLNCPQDNDNLRSCKNNAKDVQKNVLVWRNIFLLTTFHAFAIYGAWLAMVSANWTTLFFGKIFTGLFFYDQTEVYDSQLPVIISCVVLA